MLDADDNGIGLFINYQADIGIGDIVVDSLDITNGNATTAGAGTDSGGGILIDHTGIYVESGNASIEATCWGDGDWANDANTGGPTAIYTGTLNYAGDPAFVDPDSDDYHLMAGSPAIDKGIPGSPSTWTDSPALKVRRTSAPTSTGRRPRSICPWCGNRLTWGADDCRSAKGVNDVRPAVTTARRRIRPEAMDCPRSSISREGRFDLQGRHPEKSVWS
jgi:ribosomal protein L40E